MSIYSILYYFRDTGKDVAQRIKPLTETISVYFPVYCTQYVYPRCFRTKNFSGNSEFYYKSLDICSELLLFDLQISLLGSISLVCAKEEAFSHFFFRSPITSSHYAYPFFTMKFRGIYIYSKYAILFFNYFSLVLKKFYMLPKLAPLNSNNVGVEAGNTIQLII